MQKGTPIFTYKLSMEDMCIDLDSQQVDDTQIWIEALRQPFGQILLQWNVKLRVSVDHIFESLEAVAEICPLSGPFKERVDILEL